MQGAGLALAIVATLMAMAAPASAAPDLSGTVIIVEPNGFPPICNQPCFQVEKQFEVFLDGNPTGPGICPAGNNTYLYTLTHLGGAGPFVPGLTKFEVEVANTAVNVTSAGFIPGVLNPSGIDIITDLISWDFLAPLLASGQTSSQLFICSPLPPGGVTDTMVSVEGQLSLDAPGECVGPVEEANTPPVASCTESVNPAGKKVPPAGSTTLPGPMGGQNEDGFYELIGEDAEDGTADVFVTNASGSTTFGPFASGSVVKITEAPGASPSSKPIGGPNSGVAAHITLDSDAFVFAVDSFGEVSPVVSCLVPPPPK